MGVDEEKAGRVAFGQRLRELIKSYLRVTPAQFARMLGTTSPMVSRWLSGERLPDAPYFVAIANLLKKDPEELLGPLKVEVRSVAETERRAGRPKRTKPVEASGATVGAAASDATESPPARHRRQA